MNKIYFDDKLAMFARKIVETVSEHTGIGFIADRNQDIELCYGEAMDADEMLNRLYYNRNFRNSDDFYVFITERELVVDGVGRVFGFSHKLENDGLGAICVISVANILHLTFAEIQDIVCWLIDHEVGHGLKAADNRPGVGIHKSHCNHVGCVMNQVTNLSQLRDFAKGHADKQAVFCEDCRSDMLAFLEGSC